MLCGDKKEVWAVRKHVAEFVKRGLMFASGGPLILAIIYGSFCVSGSVLQLSPGEVCCAIVSITLMAFIAAGITMIYQIESLPLVSAVLIHGGVLYLDYLIMYLINSWIPRNWAGIGIFSAIFVPGFALTWLCIYLSIRAKAKRINKKLKL